jgi:hypothetical protein
MLIEDVKVVFLQIVQELFGFNCHQEGTMRMLWELISEFSSDFEVLLGIGRNSIHKMLKGNMFTLG